MSLVDASSCDSRSRVGELAALSGTWENRIMRSAN